MMNSKRICETIQNGYKPQTKLVKRRHIFEYLYFLEQNEEIQSFLKYDCCHRLADNYLLAVVFVYFKRIGGGKELYNSTNFFAALLLAHDIMEEDEGYIEITHWALSGYTSNDNMLWLNQYKFDMCKAMHFHAHVSPKYCRKMMDFAPHLLWTRIRDELHSGASIRHLRESITVTSENPTLDWLTASCASCRTAKKNLLKPNNYLQLSCDSDQLLESFCLQ